MKRDRFAQAGKIIAAILVCAGAWAIFGGLVQSIPATVGPEDNNPQKFYLQPTRFGCVYRFTCDPRAADVWLFRTGGGTMFVLQSQPDAFRFATNQWILQ
jgi:hypothetical protein